MLRKSNLTFLGASEEEDDEEVNLNVTPLIDILTCLLFFLLLSFGAIIIALINATTPALDSGTDPVDDTNKPKVVEMLLSIKEKGFEILAKGDGVPEEELNKMKKNFDLTGEGYDYQALNDFLYDIKKRYKESETIMILPDAGIPYEVLVKAMDASREREETSNGKPVRIPMFPATVIADLVK